MPLYIFFSINDYFINILIKLKINFNLHIIINKHFKQFRKKNYKTNYNHIEPELMDGIAIDLMPSLVVLEKMKIGIVYSQTDRPLAMVFFLLLVNLEPQLNTDNDCTCTNGWNCN